MHKDFIYNPDVVSLYTNKKATLRGRLTGLINKSPLGKFLNYLIVSTETEVVSAIKVVSLVDAKVSIETERLSVVVDVSLVLVEQDAKANNKEIDKSVNNFFIFYFIFYICILYIV